jgi:hypothetical protein
MEPGAALRQEDVSRDELAEKTLPALPELGGGKTEAHDVPGRMSGESRVDELAELTAGAGLEIQHVDPRRPAGSQEQSRRTAQGSSRARPDVDDRELLDQRARLAAGQAPLPEGSSFATLR